MWHALRAELAYFRSYLLGGLGLALGVVALVSGIFYAVGDDGPPSHAAAGIRGMFMIMAPLIVGFIVLAMRFEERRTRLLMAGTLTPRKLAGVTVLIPVILFAIGLFGAALTLTVDALVTGTFAPESVDIVAFVGGMLFMGTMIGLLIQEAMAAHRQRRRRAAVAGWAAFVVFLLVFNALQIAAVVLQGPLTWPMLHLGNLILAVAGMATAVTLASSRTDFTR